VTTPRCGLINRPSSVIESEAPQEQTTSTGTYTAMVEPQARGPGTGRDDRQPRDQFVARLTPAAVEVLVVLAWW
jgi:hypothetical protein